MIRNKPRTNRVPIINRSQTLTRDLALALLMTERSPSVRDAARYIANIVGTPTGGVTFTHGALRSTQSDGSVSLGYWNKMPIIGATEFTIMARIRWDGGGAILNQLFSGGTAGTPVLTIGFWRSTSGNLECAITTSGGNYAAQSTPQRFLVPVGRWCTVGVRWSSIDTNIWYYMDGAEMADGSCPAGTVRGGDEFNILNLGSLGGAFSGDMAWLLAWRRALPLA